MILYNLLIYNTNLHTINYLKVVKYFHSYLNKRMIIYFKNILYDSLHSISKLFKFVKYRLYDINM